MADNTVPDATFGDYSPENENTTSGQKNIEVCQLSGFKVSPKDLVKDYNGAWVHRDFRDIQNPLDKQKFRPEKPRASIRPQQADVFIEEGQYLLTEAGEFIDLEVEDGLIRTEGRNQVAANDL